MKTSKRLPWQASLLLFLCTVATLVVAVEQQDLLLYRDAFQQVPTPTIILDDVLCIVDLTESYIKALRSTREECVGRNIVDLIRERLTNEEATRMINVIETAHDKRSSQIVEIMDASRQHYWHVHVRPWPQQRPYQKRELIRAFLKHPRLTYSTSTRKYTTLMLTLQSTDLSTIVDHNARMTNNAVSADIYHLLVDSIDDFAIFMLDTGGYVKTWNKGAERLYQYTEIEIRGKHFTTFMSPDHNSDEVMRELDESLSGQKQHIEAFRMRKDGTLFWGSISITPLYSSSHVHIGYAKATQDLTSRIQSEQAMLNAHEQAAELKNNFLAHASHEFRSPLVGVKTGIELLADTRPTPEQTDIMAGILESGRVLSELINNLLDYNKYQMGAVKLSMSNINIREMIENLAKNFRQRTDVPIYVSVGGNVPSVLLGDGTKLQQVLSNLIDNAVKYTPKGSIHICCQTRLRSHPQLPTLSTLPSVTLLDDAKVPLLVTVKDTGIGLTHEEMNRLFKPFGQADATIAGKYGGTGLGLSICKECIQLMNGRIWVDSMKGAGSVFRFTMDLAIGSQRELSDSSNVHHSEQTRLPDIPAKIVVVDDNAVNRRMIVKLLHMSGMQTVSMTDGLDVVAYFENIMKENPVYRHDHIVTMDCQMPGMNGLDATRAIHAIPGLENVPIIGLTANVLLSDQESCRAVGMMGFISKPFKKQDLLQVILEAASMLASLQ